MACCVASFGNLACSYNPTESTGEPRHTNADYCKVYKSLASPVWIMFELLTFAAYQKRVLRAPTLFALARRRGTMSVYPGI